MQEDPSMTNVQQHGARACSACGLRPERYDGIYYEPALCYPCWKERQDAPAPPRIAAEPAVDLARLDALDVDADADDRRETRERARTVVSILERCSEELARLELVPTSDADDVNALSASKGFVARARNLLRGRFQ
jgi:hypothetical protein